jgi:Spy/CpxP family protein refolding chaperone
MNRILLTSLIMGALTAIALAQTDDQGRGPDQARGPEPGPGRWGMPRGMYSRLADELELDDAQRARFDELMAARREEMREMGERWRQVREAMRDGNEELAAQLRSELPEWRGPGSGMSEVFDELEPILRDDQLARLWEMQDRMQRGRDEIARYRTVVSELPDELDLDEAQRAEFDRILASQREQMRERFTEMRPLFDELREARRAGDEERVAELREEMEAARPSTDSVLTSFLDQLEGTLNPTQLELLAAYRQRMESPGEGKQAGPQDVRTVLRAVKRLKLSGEQKDEIRKIEREAIGAYRKIGRRNHEEQAQLAGEVKKEIIGVLDADQVEQFDQYLQRFGHRNRSGRTP